MAGNTVMVRILGDAEKLKAVFGEADKAGQTFSDKLSETGKKMQNVGKKMTVAVTAPLLAMGAAGVKSTMDVQAGLREVTTLFGQTGAAADKTFKELQKGVAGLSRELGVSQKVLTDGLYQAISAGVPKENVFDFMRVASKAAIAGVTDTQTAVDGITSIINAFGMSAADAGKVADSMFTTVKGGKTDFQQLSGAIFNIAPAAAASKVSMQEVNAAIATLTAGGTPTAVATTQIRAALVGLQRPSEAMNAIFQKLGYQNAQMAIESKGLGFALDAVKQASGGNNGALQTLLGSTEAVAAANVLAGTGSAKFRAEMEAQAKAAGATDTAFAEIDKGRNMERLTTSMQSLAIEIGNSLLPIVQQITGAITPWLQRFSELSPSTRQVILIVAGLAAALGPLISLIGSLTVVMGFLAANPIVLVIAAIAALVAGLVWAYRNVEWFRDGVNAAFRFVADMGVWLGKVFSAVWGGIVSGFVWVRDTLKSIANWLISNVINKFIDGVNLLIKGYNTVNIGGKDLPMLGKLPTFHQGGVIPGPVGTEVAILAQAGETVVPIGGSAGGGNTVINIAFNGVTTRETADQVVRILDQHFARGGALGNGRGGTLVPR